MDSQLSSRIEFFLACRCLPKLDTFSPSDPFVVVYRLVKQHQWQEFDRTEVIADNNDPSFTKQFKIDYIFEENQRLRFDVYDHDDSNSESLSAHDFIGRATFSLGEMVSSPSQSLECRLRDHSETRLVTNHKREQSLLIARCEEIAENHDSVRLELTAEDLEKMDCWPWAKSDPFVEIARAREDGAMMSVHKTEHIKRNLAPKWKPIECSVQKLCNGDYDRPLWLRVWDWNGRAPPKLIGEVQTSLSEMLEGARMLQLRLMRRKDGAGSTKSYGRVLVNRVDLIQGHSMLEYMRGGLQVRLAIAIDFTASNGAPTCPNSLHRYHTCTSHTPNEYVQAIRSIGDVVAPYDATQQFNVWGFGAKPQNGPVNHCFPINFNEHNAAITGVRGVLRAYGKCLKKIRLSGPTLFSQILDSAISLSSVPFGSNSQHYSILLIITDGAICDMRQSVDKIVELSSLPISVIIVGVGCADFSSMERLDADDEPLIDSNGRKMARDCVQFVPFREIQNRGGQGRLAKETLAEVPDQFQAYVKANSIKPMRPNAGGELRRQNSTLSAAVSGHEDEQAPITISGARRSRSRSPMPGVPDSPDEGIAPPGFHEFEP